MHRTVRLAATLAATAIAFGAIRATEIRSQPVPAVRIAPSGTSLAFAPLYVAMAKGFFDQAGVKVELTQLQSGTTADQALAGGSLDMIDASSIDVLPAIQRGFDFLAVQANTFMSQELCVSKDYASAKNVTATSPLKARVAALKGAKIGITGPGAASDRIVRFMLKHYGGVEPDTETSIVSVGGSSAMAGALDQGRIQAFSLVPPSCEIAMKGGRAQVLVRPQEVTEFKNYVHEVLFVKKSWADQHKDAVARVVRAISRANDAIVHNPADAATALHAYFPTLDDALLAQIVKDGVAPYVIKSGKMNEEMWKRVMTVAQASGVVEKPLDTREGVLWTNEYTR